MFYTDDPVADFLRYDAEQTEALERCPECCVCGNHITDDFLYEIDGDIFCEECMNDEFRKSTEDYMGD